MTGVPSSDHLSLPTGWTQGRFKHLARIRNGQDYRAVEDPDGRYPVIGSGGEFARASTYLFDGESVLLGRKGTIDKPLYVNGRFWTVDTMFYTEIARGCFPKFVYYLATTLPFDQLTTRTALPSMTQEALSNAGVLIPPFEEQCRIAAFLDHETARIDELVREQEQLIVLINEKRSAYVSHLVTQGQDSSAQKQDSGVELLGDVPSHWEVAKLGRLAVKIGSGKTPRGGATAYVDEGVLFLRSQNVYDDGLRLESVVYIDTDTDEEMRGSRVRPMDVLINITGASIGRATIVPQEFPPANVNQHVAIIRLRQPSELAKWIAVVLQTSYAKTLVQLAMSGAARDGLTGEELAQFRVPVPPLEERKAIIAHLEDLESDWAHLTDTANQSKRLLLERRSALISAAVTGQLDLRNWQPPEPEGVAEMA